MPDRVVPDESGGITRRSLLWRAGVAGAAFYVFEPGAFGLARTTPGWAEHQYWAFADRMQLLLDPAWRAGEGAYRIPGGGETSHNANVLYTHAAAARAGHTGAARQDARARALVERLCASPPWRSTAPGESGGCPSAQPPLARASGDQTHACGWGSRLGGVGGQHAVVDTVVVRGLAQAYMARSALELSDQVVALIRDRISKSANSTFYAYPALRLNQINWPIEIYACADAVLGTTHLLRHDSRLQLSRFADALVRPAKGMKTANTGPGYRFHYFPQLPASHHANVDSAEYATIVCGALLFYPQARDAGMSTLRADQLQRMRAWVDRVLCGYWTHGGYLNWDTGLGFGRWHQVKKPPLCQQSLLAIALSPRFQPTPAHGRWAKYFFDRGLALFDRWTAEREGLPPGVQFDVTRTPSGEGDSQLAVARMQANAAQACMLGLTKVRAEEPPPLYAFDPDTGRLAVTTPAYNTAVMVVNQGSFPYGGVELARFYDGNQRVAANIGGRPPASFGVTVRDRHSGHETCTQRGRLHPNLRHPPLRLVEAPRGAVGHPAAYPRQAYAGRFSRLEAFGSTSGPGVTIHTRHHFSADYVQTSWRILPEARRTGHDVSLHFPSTGSDVVVTVTLRDGTRAELSRSKSLRLTDISWLHIGGKECGYVVVLRSSALSGHARLRHPQRQASAPHAGPTVAFELIRNGVLRPLSASVRIAPARDAAHAQRVAHALGARTREANGA